MGSFDISFDLLEKRDEFIENECIFGLCSIKKGEALSRLHMQMVYQLLASSLAMVNKHIKTYLE